MKTLFSFLLLVFASSHALNAAEPTRTDLFTSSSIAFPASS